MAELLHIFVEEALSLIPVTLHHNCLRISFRNEQRVIEQQKHVKHDNFENFTKSLKITQLGV